jgi:hypothetical protein
VKKVKVNRVSLFAIIAVFVFANTLTAQDYKEDMLKIQSAYKAKCHSFSIKYLYYPYDSVKKATDSINGTCIVDSEYWYYKIKSHAGVVEYLKNEKYFIEVNHPNKVIMIGRSSLAKTGLWNINKVDSLLRLPTMKISYKEKNGNGEYEIRLDSSGSWSRMKLVFNKENYTLEEIWLYSIAKGKIFGEPYNKPVIGIFYTAYRVTVPGKSDFSEEKFVQKTKDGKFEGVGNFKEFQLLDYVNKKT